MNEESEFQKWKIKTSKNLPPPPPNPKFHLGNQCSEITVEVWVFLTSFPRTYPLLSLLLIIKWTKEVMFWKVFHIKCLRSQCRNPQLAQKSSWSIFRRMSLIHVSSHNLFYEMRVLWPNNLGVTWHCYTSFLEIYSIYKLFKRCWILNLYYLISTCYIPDSFGT